MHWAYLKWILLGLFFLGLHIAVAALSPQLTYDHNLVSKPILLLVTLEVIAGAAYLFAVRGIESNRGSKKLVIWIIALGLLFRASMFVSNPILEIDFYRYFWDGAVMANGVNPYAYAPSQVLEQREGVPVRLHELAQAYGPAAARINHPFLHSIYPPITVAGFALAYWIQPWSLLAWRVVLLLFDLAILAILVLILRALYLPVHFIAIYWWNPLLVKEIFNSGHMDLIVLLFLLGAVLFSLRGRYFFAVGSLALATGAKVWPVLLLPLVLKPLFSYPKKMLQALCLFGVLVSLLFFPMYYAGAAGKSGLLAYAERWELNDGFFQLMVFGAQFLLNGIGIHPGYGQRVARISVLIILALWTAWIARTKERSAKDFCRGCLLVIAAVFLLSPTQFPWYYVWLIPFLAMIPQMSLLLLTALLPLYYLRFYFEGHNRVDVFDRGLVWLEYAPVWGAMIREWYVHHRQRAPSQIEVAI